MPLTGAFCPPGQGQANCRARVIGLLINPIRRFLRRTTLKRPAQDLKSSGFPRERICGSSCLGGWMMSAPLPDALRVRFQKLVEEGLSGCAAALRLKLSRATGARWRLAIRRTGRARTAPQGRPRGKGKLDPHRSFLIELIDQDGDMTMSELDSREVNAAVQLRSIWSAPPARESDRPATQAGLPRSTQPRTQPK